MGDSPGPDTRPGINLQLRLLTSDEEEFTVEWEVIRQSRLIEGMVEDIGDSSEPIPLPNVSSEVMKKILEWSEHHRHEPPYNEEYEDSEGSGAAHMRLQNLRDFEVSEWDSKWILFGSDELLFKVLMAANYLDIRLLLNIGIKTIANMLKGKTTEEMRERFKIVNDFTPEEEEEIRKQIEWADND